MNLYEFTYPCIIRGLLKKKSFFLNSIKSKKLNYNERKKFMTYQGITISLYDKIK